VRERTLSSELGDLALSSCDLPLAERCAQNAKDLAGLLMLYTASGNRAGVSTLAHDALNQGKFNVAFVSFFILGQVEECYELLVRTKRVPEAALFARTFLPSHISSAVALWRKDLEQVSERAAAALADPAEYPNLFPDLDCALKVEEIFKQNRGKIVSASAYQSAKDDLDLDLISLMKSQHAPTTGDAEFADFANSMTRPTEECASTNSINVEPVLTSGSFKDDIEAEAREGVLEGKLNESSGNEADAILNDDFGDDDDW